MVSKTLKIKNKPWWKFFFWVFTLLTTAGMALLVFSPESKWYEILFDIPLYALVITGLYGFSYNKKYFTTKVWLYILFLLILSDIYNWYDTIFSQETWGITNMPFISITLFALIVALLNLLPYLALYRYSLKSPEIWDKEETTAKQMP